MSIAATTEGSEASASTPFWLAAMVVLWGLSWPATKLLLADIPPLWLGFFRFASSGLCLFTFLAARGKLRLPPRADWPIVASVGLLQMLAFTALGLVAMQYTDAGHAVLLAYTTPLWGLLAAWVLFGETPSRRQILALGVGLSGIALIVSPLEMEWSGEGVVMGNIFLLLAAIAWSGVILHVKRHRWTSSALALAPWQMALASLPMAGLAWGLEGPPPTLVGGDGSTLALLAFIGPVATSACFIISSEHGRRISTFAMTNVTLGVPLVGILSSVLLLGSRPSTLFGLGLVLIVAGVVMAAAALRGGTAPLASNRRKERGNGACLGADAPAR